MHAIKRKNPLTEPFLAQLDVDLESAGLDSLRLQPKTAPKPGEEHQSCSGSGLIVMNDPRVPTYGDRGLAAFNCPTQNIVDVDARSISATLDPMGYTNRGTDFNTTQTGLPSRPRASGQFISDMDISPDGSGDQQYSGSSTRNVGSSHTPSTSYSPQQHQPQTDPNRLATVFDPVYPVMNLGNGFNGVQQPGGASDPTHNWDNGVQGFSGSTAQGSGFNTLSGGELGDVMAGMSDAEWNTVFESMTGWDSGLDQVSMNVS